LGALPASNAWNISGLSTDPRSGIVYAGSTAYPSIQPNGFWKSTDCGAHWARAATGRNGSDIISGSPTQIAVDPVTSDVYAGIFHGASQLYRSHNGAIDFDNISPSEPGFPGFVQSWSIDPTDRNHIVATFHEDCVPPNTSQCLAETHNGLDAKPSWRALPGVNPNGHWAEGVGPFVVGAKILYAAPFGGLYAFTGPTTPWKQLAPYPGCAPLFATAGNTYYVGCLDVIRASTDLETWTAVPGSPKEGRIAATGKYLYANTGDASTPIHRAPLANLSSWSVMPLDLSKRVAPGFDTGGGLHYDSTHHVLYFSAYSGGLWRLVTD
jgi:hypothetical protein